MHITILSQVGAYSLKPLGLVFGEGRLFEATMVCSNTASSYFNVIWVVPYMALYSYSGSTIHNCKLKINKFFLTLMSTS